MEEVEAQLVRDVLDKGLVDSDGFKVGKVDDLLLELREGECPSVRAIVTQHGALTPYLGKTVERVAAWLREHLLGLGPEVEPITIPWDQVTRIDVVVHLDLRRNEVDLCKSEGAVWERWIKHLPFAER